ncbi:hypothetical protein vseg_007182 [Gypsophila vaccaria]
MGRQNLDIESSAHTNSTKKSKKKRRVPEIDTPLSQSFVLDKSEEVVAAQIDDNEPTIADKLASLDVVKNGDADLQEMQVESQKSLTPSADSVHVLLKQALHADDRGLLFRCIYNHDNKVITKSVSLLSGADIFKLLDSLISIIQMRGKIVVFALPWLRSLLLQHSSRIISKKSSLKTLNSLYQLIESRVETYTPAQKLAASLDLLFTGVRGTIVDEHDSVTPAIYEFNDESDKEEDEEESEEDAMDTDEDTKEPEDFSGISDADLSDEDFSD